MNRPYQDDEEGVTVPGFEVPGSPVSSYDNAALVIDEEAQDPPLAPPHLQNSLVSIPTDGDTSSSLPLPERVTLNHLCVQKNTASVALGYTHRYRSKYVTVVVFKPIPRR